MTGRGRRADTLGEIALSRAAAGQIGAVPGDTVTVGCDDSGASGEYTLVGLTVDPAATGAVTAAAVAAPGALGDARLWLTDDAAVVNGGIVAQEAKTGSVAVGYRDAAVRRASESAPTGNASCACSRRWP